VPVAGAAGRLAAVRRRRSRDGGGGATKVAVMDDHFAQDLADLGFTFTGRDRQGVMQYARRPNRYLTEWVHDDLQHALFTWEFELGEYVASLEWQIGAAETSLHILYPQRDVRVPRDTIAVVGEIERLEMRLSRLDLTDPQL